MTQKPEQVKTRLVDIHVASLNYHPAQSSNDEHDAAIRYWMQDINGGHAVRNRIARKFSQLHSFDLAQKQGGIPSSHRPNNLGNTKPPIVPPRGCFALLGPFNVMRRADRVITSSTADNTVSESRRVRRLKAQLDLLFVNAKKSGFVVQTCPEDDQLLDYDFDVKTPIPRPIESSKYATTKGSTMQDHIALRDLTFKRWQLVDMQFDCSSSSNDPDDDMLPGTVHASPSSWCPSSSVSSDDREQSPDPNISASCTPKDDTHSFGSFNTISLKVASLMTSSKASNAESKIVQQPDAELNALVVDAKKSGSVVRTSYPEENLALLYKQAILYIAFDYGKASMLRARKFSCSDSEDYALRQARLGHGRGTNTRLFKRNKLESHIKLESAF